MTCPFQVEYIYLDFRPYFLAMLGSISHINSIARIMHKEEQLVSDSICELVF